MMISHDLRPIPTTAGFFQAIAELNNVVILNDNNPGQARADQSLSVMLTVQSIVETSLESIADAKGLLKQIGLGDWFEVYLQANIDDIAKGAVPEIRAMIERLEVEAKR